MSTVSKAPTNPNNAWQGPFLASVANLLATEKVWNFYEMISVLRSNKCDDVRFGILEGLLKSDTKTLEKESRVILLETLLDLVSSTANLSPRSGTLSLKICRQILGTTNFSSSTSRLLQDKISNFSKWILVELLPTTACRSRALRTEALILATRILTRTTLHQETEDKDKVSQLLLFII